MLTVDEALRAVLERCSALPPQRRSLIDADGLVLAEDVAADLDLPPFDKALVDGYAVRVADLPSGEARLEVTEEIAAGRNPTRPLERGQAAQIMTGAPLPRGADAVIMVEQTRRDGGQVVIVASKVRAGQNRLVRGRELREGEVVLRRGDVINPARLGLLASVGRGGARVVPRPTVRIVPTGDELVEPDQVPGPGQIRNSNAVTLEAMARRAGALTEVQPIAPDRAAELAAALNRGLEAVDVLVITGGVSAGNLDLVPRTLEENGVARVFHKVRVRPGKPLWFGVGPPREGAGGTLVFGLPGNPVSGIVGFLLFVAPALRVLAGRSAAAVRPRHPLARAFSQSGDRAAYHPCRILADGPRTLVDPLDWAGSADLRAVAGADGFAAFPAGDRVYEAGEVVDFLPLE